MAEPFDLADTYMYLPPTPEVRSFPGGHEFWAGIGERTDLDDGRLISQFRNDANWDHWECHPEGDEVLILLSGALDLRLMAGETERRVALRGRATFIMPAGTWHTADVREPGDLIAITWGKGTMHRPR